MQSSETVSKFLADVSDDATSDAALHAKASILYEEATRIGARYRASTLSAHSTGLVAHKYFAAGISPKDAEFSFLDRKIDRLAATLPPIQSKHMLLVHTICHGATIQLHSPLETVRMESHTKQLVAARAMVDILLKTDVPNMGLIDPVLAVCLSMLAPPLNLNHFYSPYGRPPALCSSLTSRGNRIKTETS